MLQTGTVVIPYNPTELQKKLHNDTHRHRVIVCGRRAGKSTFALNEAVRECFLNARCTVWIVCPTLGQAKDIYWRDNVLMGEYIPRELISKKNESELLVEFINGSVLQLKGSDRPETLRGSGLKLLIVDETAEHKNWDSVWGQILEPTLTDKKGKAVFIGTPKGHNHFYELYKRELQDESYKSFHFKTVDNPHIDQADIELKRLSAVSELEKMIFRQEYDATFEVLVGRPRFDIEQLVRLREKCVPELDKDGDMFIWENCKPNRQYIIGVDVAEGLESGDNSVAVVLDPVEFKVVAKYKGKLEPDYLGDQLAIWGKRWNNAHIAVEQNNHGLTTLSRLKDKYHNLYHRKTYDTHTNKYTTRLGWLTTTKTKPYLIDNLATAIKQGLKIPSLETIDELMTFVIKENGTTSAQEGKHDDEVIALAIANQARMEGSFKDTPKEPEKKRFTIWQLEQENKRVKDNWRQEV